MKRLSPGFFLLFAALLAASSASAATGAEWAVMTEEEKEKTVYGTIILFDQEGVQLHRPPGYYMRAIDRILEHNPELAREDIASIFASAVYRFEPGSRPAMEEMQRRWKSKTTVAN